MLSKLLKYEFRATGRILLPMLGAVTGLILLANLSVRLLDRVQSGLLVFVFGFVIVAAFIAVILAEIMPVIVMVLRFYRNLLGSEGYLMHTLPVNVHQLVWSKLIVSLVWVLVTNLFIFLLGGLSALFQSGTNLAEIFRGLPSLAELAEMFPGVTAANLTTLLIEICVLIILASLVSCLHFYAAMSLGHIFSRDKILMSVLFFIGITILFNVLGNLLSLAGIRHAVNLESFEATWRTVLTAGGWAMLGLAIRGAILYLLTVLGLRRGLNLA